jgi:hypothetical protein
MTLANLKKICAAYHKVATSALTVDSVDLFLVAANNVRSNAELLHNFELSRVQATLSIDGTTGGALSDAVIGDNTSNTIVVSGTIVPDVTGNFTQRGLFSGYPFYILEGVTPYFIYYNTGLATYVISAALSTGVVVEGWIPATDITTPIGSFVGTAGLSGITGTATTAYGSTQNWSGIKEVIAVQRTNTDGILVPLDFTRADIPIERDRYELEMSEDYEAYRRYPSDAALLQRGSNGTIIQRGRKLFVYPVDAISSTPLSVTLEAYGRLADYTVANLSDTEPTDFFVEFGATYMQWAIITELNYLFKTFSPRTEGNLSPPEQAREQAWRNLLLWDTYLVDANATRSR